MICPKHQAELVHRVGTSKKTGKGYDFYGCPQKDGNMFCDFTAPGQPTTPAPQRDAMIGQVLASLNNKADKILEGQLELKQLLASIGAREPVVPGPSDKKLPF